MRNFGSHCLKRSIATPLLDRMAPIFNWLEKCDFLTRCFNAAADWASVELDMVAGTGFSGGLVL